MGIYQLLFLNESFGIDVVSTCRLVNIILHFLADPFLPFLPCVTLTLFRGARVYCIRRRISMRSIGCVISYAIDTRETTYHSATNFRHSRYIIRAYHTRCLEHGRNERKLIGLSGDLTSSCTVMSVKLPLPSLRREDTCCFEIVSTCKCGVVRKRLHGILLVNILWVVFI